MKKKNRDRMSWVLSYICLMCVFVFGMIAIIGSGASADDGQVGSLSECLQGCIYGGSICRMTCYTIWGDPQDNLPGETSVYQCISDNCPRLWPGGPRDWKCERDCGYVPPVHAGLATTAVPRGGVYNEAQEVELIANADISPFDVCLLLSDDTVIRQPV